MRKVADVKRIYQDPDRECGDVESDKTQAPYKRTESISDPLRGRPAS